MRSFTWPRHPLPRSDESIEPIQSPRAKYDLCAARLPRAKLRRVSVFTRFYVASPIPLSPPVILVNERKALKQCHGSCNMKSIMSRVAESTEQVVRKHLSGITLAQLVRKVVRN